MTVAAYDIKEYFPLEGSWTYRVIKDNESVEEKVESHTNEVIEDTKTLKFIYSENNYKYWFIDAEGVKQAKELDEDGFVVYKPPRLVFPAIETGTTKNFLTSYDSYKNDNSLIEKSFVIKCNIRLDSSEDVETPAGKFPNCLKFVSNSRVEKKNGYEYDYCSAWLALNTGIVKEVCVSSDDFEDEGVEISTETRVLISATIEGKKIGGR